MNRFEAYEFAARQELGERGYSRRERIKDVGRLVRNAAVTGGILAGLGAMYRGYGILDPYFSIRFASEAGYDFLERTEAVYTSYSQEWNTTVGMGDSNTWGDVEKTAMPPYPSGKYIAERMRAHGKTWEHKNIAMPGMVSEDLLERVRKSTFKDETIGYVNVRGNMDWIVGVGGYDPVLKILLNPVVRKMGEELVEHPLLPWTSRENLAHNVQWTDKAARLAEIGQKTLQQFETNHKQILETLLQLRSQVPGIQHIFILGVPYITLQDKLSLMLRNTYVEVDFAKNPEARKMVHGMIATINKMTKKNVADLQPRFPGVIHFIPVGDITTKDDLRYEDIHLTKAGQEKVAKHQLSRLVDRNGNLIIAA